MSKTKFIKLPYTVLIYDIETYLSLKTWVWRLGKQVLRHSQLDACFNQNDIICINYKWYGSKKTHSLSGPEMIQDFDALVKTADVTLGKNSDSFDRKHINSKRMLEGLPAYPEWADTGEDLERQLRRHFEFPSQSLDYVSSLLGFGGKLKMEFDDWIKISNLKHIKRYKANKRFKTDHLEAICQTEFNKGLLQTLKEGIQAFKKMVRYGKKDVTDTERVLQRVLPYIRLRHNASDGINCVVCGSKNIHKTKKIIKGQTKYQQFECLDHRGYAGKCTYRYMGKSHTPTYGKMGN